MPGASGPLPSDRRFGKRGSPRLVDRGARSRRPRCRGGRRCRSSARTARSGASRRRRSAGLGRSLPRRSRRVRVAPHLSARSCARSVGHSHPPPTPLPGGVSARHRRPARSRDRRRSLISRAVLARHRTRHRSSRRSACRGAGIGAEGAPRWSRIGLAPWVRRSSARRRGGRLRPDPHRGLIT
jgi:hypothetical protein